MGKYSTLSALLSAIADAIRSKTGGKAPLAAEDFPEAIGGIVTGGGVDTGDATATAGDIPAASFRLRTNGSSRCWANGSQIRWIALAM